MLSFKEALAEIFVAAMASGQLLEDLCDGVLSTSVAPLPHTYNKFITLGEYRVGDVLVGNLQKKFRLVELEIQCCAVARAGKSLSEEDAEEASYLLASAVRTVLKGNKTLVSTSYPDGVAIVSEPMDETLYYLIYDEMPVAVNDITYAIKMVESD